MNWTTFLLTLTLAYAAYYGLNLLFDLLITRKPPASQDNDEILFFEEHTEPQLIDYQEEPEPVVPPEPEPREVPQPPVGKNGQQNIASAIIHATGAVGLKQLFSLAKGDLIEHTRAIPY
ncbi:hypothetical protein [Sphingobacterium daejeonense]|uniref:hypothetical protein n=1 Tax=Sphingobacterium daejeonense TaxID=371142 RepID=UPI0010C5A1BE|nr:hypothetical protein [Sphingobacterium daejeonense]VTP91428.1 Uncharacterised protein [Sphingobacterium daejeonense]